MLSRCTLVAITTLAFCSQSLHAQQVQPAGGTRATDSARARPQFIGAVDVVSTTTGTGRSRTLNALSAEMMQAVSVTGTSALKALEKLPGVNFQSADPWGTYEWSNRVTIRGFQSGQVGQTFDGIPLGDMSYGNHNGLGIGRAVDPDNLEATSVAQGSGALATSSNNNLGGVIQYSSGDPANTPGFTLRQMAGQAAARRTFGRWDSGLKSSGNLGWKAYVSFGRIDNDKWKGSGERFSPVENTLLGDRGGLFGVGETYQDQLNTKLVFLAGATKVTAFYNLADRKEADYTDLSLARFRASGRDWDQFSDWRAAQSMAASATPDEAYFHSAIGARRDHLAYLSGELPLGERARIVITPYVHTNKGNGDWHAPSYGSSFSPDPIYFRQTQYDNNRVGSNARFAATFGVHEFEAGAWVERNESHIRRVGWRLRNYSTGPEVDFTTVLRLFFDRTGTTTSTMAYAQNTTAFLDGSLKLTYGAKFLRVGAEFENNKLTIPGALSAPDTARPSLSIPTEGGILPQFGAVYRVTQRDELFANVSQNVNAYPYSPQSGVYNTSPTAYQFFKDSVKPEKATTMEVGVRTRRDVVEASLALFTIDYRNRLIGVAVCPLTATCVSSFANVGTVTSRGAEGLALVHLSRRVQWLTSASYTSATIDENYRSGTTTIEAAGKKIVDVPDVMGSTTLKYDDRRVLGNIGVRHVGKRYFSILNDMAVDAYTTVDAGAGYRLGALGALKELTLQLNVTNLLDEEHISTMGTGGFSVRGDLQTLQAGAKRLLFITVGTRF